MPDDRLLDQLTDIVEKSFWPSAERFDRSETISIDRFMPLADAGLFGIAVPAASGGLGLAPPNVRRVLRTVSSGCGATAFMFAQHHGAANAVAMTENDAVRERWLPCVTDRTLIGTAYGHVRRARQPVVEAVPDGAGRWLFSGEAPWATSWGVASAYTVAAVTPDGELVWALFESDDHGVSAPAPLDLMVFGQTGTVRMRFDEAVVDESNLLSVSSLEEWRDRDRFIVSRPSPLALGVGDRTFALLEESFPDLADEHRAGWLELCERSEAVSQAVDRNEADVVEVATVRAEAILTVQRLTTVLMSALGGRAAELSQPAQRLAREALFYVVQGQAEDGRQAFLKVAR